MTPVTVESILTNWRIQICFADTVRLADGEYATVVGAIPGNLQQLDLVLGHPSRASKGRAKLTREMLFPAWWPEEQFEKAKPSKGTAP